MLIPDDELELLELELLDELELDELEEEEEPEGEPPSLSPPPELHATIKAVVMSKMHLQRR